MNQGTDLTVLNKIACARVSTCAGERNFIRISHEPKILDKINGKPRPPLPPNQGWENGAFLPFARLQP